MDVIVHVRGVDTDDTSVPQNIVKINSRKRKNKLKKNKKNLLKRSAKWIKQTTKN